MNREEIILLVQEAVIGFPNENPFDFRLLQIETIERFAALVAAVEREACAKICDGYKEYGDPITNWAVDCAAAIRARGTK
jgi:hypothetical protein